MTQTSFLEESSSKNSNRKPIGADLVLEFSEDKQKVFLYRNGTFIKNVDISDIVAKRLFIVEVVELGASKSHLALALNISRQTIHNYLEIKKYFGLEGLIHGYTPSESKNRGKQREMHANDRIQGNKAKIVAEIREEASKAQEEREQGQTTLTFSFGYDGQEQKVEPNEQPFVEEHGWESTRYAGIFTYMIPLITEWKWLNLIMGYFGTAYKIFMVFLLMGARNIRSIEQLKNVRVREAGAVLGIKRIPARPKIWEWFYNSASKQFSNLLKKDYFRYQIRAGLVCIWLWFTDGHLLPYNGKEKVRWSYYTQRRMPFPGQTNLVTCDSSGRIVDFEIQEGKGDLRSRIKELKQKWQSEVPDSAVMVFDREGDGVGFFSGLVKGKTHFVTWEKNADSKELAALDDELFIKDLKLNGKAYSIFEGEKSFTYKPENPEEEKHNFKLRRIYLWNRTSNRRTCGLAWTEGKEMSTEECALAILSRWGASENSFKHIANRHPLHYHPGFRLVKSENQEISNPAIKEKQGIINKLKKGLGKLYKRLANTKEALNKDGKPRNNSLKEQLKMTIVEQEAQLKRVQKEKSQLPEKVDVSTLENYRLFKRIDNEGKNLFDFVTCSVWNARKQVVDWLRPIFDQENDLVDLFYAITDCQGWVKSTKQEVIVRLEPLQQPKRRQAQEQLCRKLTAMGAQTPTGKWLVIEVGESPMETK